ALHHHAKADVVAGIAGAVPVIAAGGPAFAAAAPPRAAACRLSVTITRAQGIDRGAAGVIVRVVEVAAPFPDVAVHVVEAKGIGRIAADRRRALNVRPLSIDAIGNRAIEIGLVGRGARAPPERRAAAGAAGMLPFRLGRQTIAPAAGALAGE